MTRRTLLGALLSIVTAVLPACGQSGPVVVVHVSGPVSSASALHLAISFNEQPARQIETFAPPVSELHLQLPVSSVGRLALQIDAENCHECIASHGAATRFLAGSNEYNLTLELEALPAPICPAGLLHTPRWFYTPMLIDRGPHSGKVLVFSGANLESGENSLLPTEIYDPKTLTSTPGPELFSSAAEPKRLADGRIVMEGGYDAVQDRYVEKTQIYDPMLNEFRLGAPLVKPRSGHTSVVLADGRLLAMAGKSEPPRRETPTAEIYDPVKDQWTRVDDMKHARLYASSVRLSDGRVMVSGGASEAGVFPTEIEIFDPAAPAGSQWSLAGNLRQGRWQHVSHLLPNGKVLLVGGSRDSTPVGSSELFDPALPPALTEPVPAAPYPFANAAFVPLPDGSLLVAGGGSGKATANTQIFNPSTGRFEMGRPLAQPRAAHGAVLLPDGSVILLSGVGGVITTDPSAVGLLLTERLYLNSCL